MTENLNPREQYLGNPNLKKAFTPSEFTEDQILELEKCINDPKYFITIDLQFVNYLDSLVSQQSLLHIFYTMFYLMRM